MFGLLDLLPLPLLLLALALIAMHCIMQYYKQHPPSAEEAELDLQQRLPSSET
jgi:hypothetical protein